jgi:hypothetical protein
MAHCDACKVTPEDVGAELVTIVGADGTTSRVCSTCAAAAGVVLPAPPPAPPPAELPPPAPPPAPPFEPGSGGGGGVPDDDERAVSAPPARPRPRASRGGARKPRSRR